MIIAVFILVMIGAIGTLVACLWLERLAEREHRAFQRELDAIMLGQHDIAELWPAPGR
jgi:hypothetical protein